MPVLKKEIAAKLQEYSLTSDKVKELTKKEKEVENTILEKDMYKNNRILIESFVNEVSSTRDEMKKEIKGLKEQKENLKDEITSEVQEKYEAPFKTTLPGIGSIAITIEETEYFNPDSVEKKELIQRLLDEGNLDCLMIDEEKYLELAKEKDLPGIYTKTSSKITIRG